MEAWLSTFPEHGYQILVAFVFLEAVGLPVPAALALLIAGGASARGSLDPTVAWGSALTAMMLGDTIMFVMGRYTGWWLLGLLCRLSLNPESCILRSADSFYRRGRILLVFAKFVPGINTMAPPMAGSMNMRVSQFMALDFTGVALYISSYFLLGYAFSSVLESITSGYQAFGRVLTRVIVLALVGYVGAQLWMWTKTRRLGTVPMVRPGEVSPELFQNALIYDVRSHGYYDPQTMRIQGSRRLDPHSLNNFEETLAAEQFIYLYCTCVREATSARVARILLARGVRCFVIEGGLRAWKKAGLPIERVPSDEMTALPVFGA